MAIRLPNILERTNKWVLLSGIMIGAILFRILLLATNSVPFNSDEAIVALMARHILHGIDFPLFFYGQAYMGSFDAILVAIGFSLLGEHVWVIRLVQLILYLGIILSTYFFAFDLTQTRTLALLAGLLLMIPPVNVILYTTVSLGGYGEALLIGNLILLIATKIRKGIAHEQFSRPGLGFWLGILMGFGFWVFGLTLVFSVSSVIYLGWVYLNNQGNQSGKNAFSKTVLFLIFGAVLGLTPIFIQVFSHESGGVIRELFGSAIAGTGGRTYLQQLTTSVKSLLLLGSTVIFGIRPPWEVRWLAFPLIPLILAFWAAVFYAFLKKGSLIRSSLLDQGAILVIVVMLTLLGFVLTPFGADPSGRYFLPLTVPMTVLAGSFIWQMSRRWKYWLWILPVLLLSFHFFGTLQSAMNYPPGITTQFDAVTQIDHKFDQELMVFLDDEDIKFGYTNYWVSYPLAFLSHESQIFVPVLPYHQDFRYTSRDNRYPPYNELVDNSKKIAYITTNHPQLNIYLRNEFKAKHIFWSEKTIGDYHIFYDLSIPIAPTLIGLGTNR